MSDDVLEGLRRLGRRSGETPEPGRRGRHRQLRGVRRRWPRRVLITANILSAFMVLGAGGAWGYVRWRFAQIRHIAVPGIARTGHSGQSRNDGSSTPPFTLLVIGSDTRNLGAGSSAAFGSASDVGGQRSDSIILVRLVPKTRSLALLSIPRDTRVAVPGYGTT